MGRASEGVWVRQARERRIREYQTWHGWRNGPKGTITDDTQMTMWLSKSILAYARWAGEAGLEDVRDHVLDPDDFAKRFTRERIRGIGQAAREFVHNYKDLGKPLALSRRAPKAEINRCSVINLFPPPEFQLHHPPGVPGLRDAVDCSMGRAALTKRIRPAGQVEVPRAPSGTPKA